MIRSILSSTRVFRIPIPPVIQISQQRGRVELRHCNTAFGDYRLCATAPGNQLCRSNRGKMGDYELLFSGKVNDVIPVSKYRSNKTGLRIFVANVEGPIVNGYFCLATEAFDDDGLPHTLEHLVFMGSEEYPYKGLLDLLANRCLASGTNAWTDTDHTCYTMTTAGSEGFLNLLPVFLDHVLYPNLTEPAYLTEVHHVNEEGEDAGVVYCEMQGRENTGESLTHLALLRAMYPGHCGYKSETGGILANLRTSTSHEKVCNYHRDFYRAENLCLIITGMIQPEAVFSAVQAFENKIASKPSLAKYVRPWESPVPPLSGGVDQRVLFPSDDEEHGMVTIGWRGPLAKDQYNLTALSVMLVYLSDTAVAPLEKHFVEVDEPFCTDVRYSIIENAESCFYLKFNNVPKAKLNLVKTELLGLLGRVASGEEAIDMVRMDQVLHRRILEAMSALEDHPHDSIAFNIIGEFLYGHTKEDLEVRINQIDSFKKLRSEKLDFWTGLLHKYIIDKISVTIIGEASERVMEEKGAEEKKRVEAQRQALGEAGLKKKGEELSNATAANEVEPPNSVLSAVKVPSVDSIHFHTINPSSNHSNGKDNPSFPLADIPVLFELDDIKTNFVMMNVVMDTACVPGDLAPYLSLYTEIILESPILRDTGLVSHEVVVQELAADTVSNDCSIGLNGKRFACGNFCTQVILSLKVEMEKYSKGISWLQELLYRVQFTEERVKIVAQKMANDVSMMKRKGPKVVKTLSTEINFTRDCNNNLASMFRQHKFLSGLLQRVEGSEAVAVIEALNKLRSLLTAPENLRIHIAAHVERLAKIHPHPHLPWTRDFLPQEVSSPKIKRPCVKKEQDFLAGVSSSRGLLVGVGAVESSYLIVTAEGVTDYIHPDTPAIMAYIQYLTQLEGPMWRQIRGLGLSYHYSMYVKPETGLIYFILYKSTHIVNAYKQAKQIIDGYLSGDTPLEQIELETCKSSLIFEIIEEQKTPAAASEESMFSYLYGLPHSYQRELIQKVSQLSLADLNSVGEKYFKPLFDGVKSRSALVCHPTKVDEIKKDFAELGHSFDAVSIEESFLSDF